MEFMMEEILPDDGKEKSVWDKHVPIVKSGNTYDVYIMAEIVNPIEYNELCHMFRSLSSKDTVYLHLNTPGGQIDSTLMIINAIKECEALVIAKLHGTVASAGTMLTLSCDTIETNISTSFMIHYFSGGTSGKGNEIKAHTQFMDKHTPKVFHRIYDGFLTDKEIEDMIDGKDIWLDGDEVMERFEKRATGVTYE